MAALCAYGGPVYPRVCGGTTMPSNAASWYCGLSPRVRGNLGSRISRYSLARSIPACAGEPLPRRVASGWRGVYPRVCGGTTGASGWFTSTRGLSPRVRGNQHRIFQELSGRRSIPACAGEPLSNPNTGSKARVYPRVCGGTARRTGAAIAAWGLSPRVRGNPAAVSVSAAISRSIPACAGEPGKTPPVRPSATVYPRVCGGTLSPSRILITGGGLSPRVRGNRAAPAGRTAPPRSIPACAGEPLILPPPSWAGPVYPRVCGGTRGRGVAGRRRIGLSPRVRGNRAAPQCGQGLAGSIPACAGEPTASLIWTPANWVYPRVCGGTTLANPNLAPGVGLSPRVRGNPTPRPACPAGERSIPACAGEPMPRRRRGRTVWVYPRVCGGTPRGSAPDTGCPGLSPRVRGNPGYNPGRQVNDRSIPACAGEPIAAGKQRRLAQVYPRVCGGTSPVSVRSRQGGGLSPRVRGNPGFAPGPPVSHRSIPACAGEPRRADCRAEGGAVYPRVCGGT